MYPHMYPHTPTHTHTNEQTHTRKHTHTHSNTHTITHTHTHTPTKMYADCVNTSYLVYDEWKQVIYRSDRSKVNQVRVYAVVGMQ